MKRTRPHDHDPIRPKIEETYEAFLRFAEGAFREHTQNPPADIKRLNVMFDLSHRFADLVSVLQDSFSKDARTAFRHLEVVEHKLGNEFDVNNVFFAVLH